MKKKKNIEDFNNSDWYVLASVISEEKDHLPTGSEQFLSGDIYDTEHKWKQLRKMGTNKQIDIDKAWNNLHSRISEETGRSVSINPSGLFSFQRMLRIAAVFVLLTGLGLASLYLFKLSPDKTNTALTDADTRKLEVLLADGSTVILNHDSKLVYPSRFKDETREVELKGEAFFTIKPDASHPFIVNTGEARIRVVGTSFNVITENVENEVEVFVETGIVEVTDNDGNQNITLEQGYLGRMSSEKTEKYLNNDQNYLSWNTNILTYTGQKLEVVFRDLKRVYDIEMVTDNPGILNQTLSTTFDNETEETIIALICTPFNLDYQKDGKIYYLSEK